MWIYDKKLQYPVHIKNPNPALAKVIISQLGGPHGGKIGFLQVIEDLHRVFPPVEQNFGNDIP